MKCVNPAPGRERLSSMIPVQTTSPASLAETIGRRCRTRWAWRLLWLLVLSPFVRPLADPATLQKQFQGEIQPILQQYCLDCHNAEKHKGDLDLSRFKTLDAIFAEPEIWEGVIEQIHLGEMPPKDKPQPKPDDRTRLVLWVTGALTEAAKAVAGDPGPVVLRRLNNAEYTYTLRDLTGVASLDPAREFPADSAAGEGFMNTGNTLVMSPSLLTKYLDAAKEVASHAVLLPDGVRFSEHQTERDWTDEAITRIRDFYRPFVASDGDSGVIPVATYLTATLEERSALEAGRKSVESVAKERGLNARYLQTLWAALHASNANGSVLLAGLRDRWSRATPADAPALAADINRWQKALWKFNSIGHLRRHLGGNDGPPSWMEAANPVASKLEVRLKLNPPGGQTDVVVYLAAGDAGDGPANDWVVWDEPRLVIPGRPDLLLRDVREFVEAMDRRRSEVVSSTARCLAAAAQASAETPSPGVEELARQHQVAPDILSAWLDYLGLGTGAPMSLDLMTQRMDKPSTYDFVQGWGSPETPLIVANASTEAVRIPGNLKGHGVAVHPSPTLNACVGWKSPIRSTVRIESTVTHAHPECGNGVTWALELRRGSLRQRLAAGVAQGGTPVHLPPVEALPILPGDLISLIIGPRDGNHSCDLTDVELVVKSDQEWRLTADVSPDLLAGNPHADRLGNSGVWSFYTEPATGSAGPVIPAGSLLASWQSAPSMEERRRIAQDVELLMLKGPTHTNSPDALLHRQLTSLGGPLFAGVRNPDSARRSGTSPTSPSATPSNWGLDPGLFGRHPQGAPLAAGSLCVQAPRLLEIRLPADLVAGCELVTTGHLDPAVGNAGSVQLQVQTQRPEDSGIQPGIPVVVMDDGPARRRVEASFDDFRQLFPGALCYYRIVPVDEAVTLTLYHREDEPLQRLFLDDTQRQHLNRLWDELFYISREPVLLLSAFEQIYEYATQDRPDMVKSFGPMRAPIQQRAAAFKQREVDSEPTQLDAVIAFAGRAYRRNLRADDAEELRQFYRGLRQKEIPHDEALRLTLARVLVAPAFLYRMEQPGPGRVPGPVEDWELATRLSYFLWSSGPDDALRAAAASGSLRNPDVLAAQARRMVRDPRIRRLAEEFGCAWLHIHGFNSLDEKSERHFPSFAGLRESMYEETIRTFTDFFENNRPVLDLLDADDAILNGPMAEFYGIPGVEGKDWRRVKHVKPFGRGGLLGHATILAKQSGASRTSPILRGNWLCEALLGDKLPRPPKGVPVLPEEPPAGLTERQLTEQHSRDPKCAACHVRIDPYGYSLEAYDAIGRRRTQDAAGLPINTQVSLADGTAFDGLDGLRNYLITQRRQDFIHQFCRKLLGYALGRAVQLSDKPLLQEMETARSKPGRGAADAVEMIVRSKQFREIRGRDYLSKN